MQPCRFTLVFNVCSSSTSYLVPRLLSSLSDDSRPDTNQATEDLHQLMLICQLDMSANKFLSG